jgi:DNA-binding NarL/FixJ family response regulator
MTIRILIADDHPLFRDGLHGLLDSLTETEVVGEAATMQEVISLADALQPDVILMDIKMPGGSGIAATRQILNQHPQINILVVTMFDDDDSVFAAMRAGARGYVLKDASQEEMLQAIRAVAGGAAIFSPAIAQRMIGFFGSARSPIISQAFPTLSDREREILALLASGRSNHEIAEHFSLSIKTVQNHVSAILNKLHVTDRTQAILRARAAGIE